MNSTFYYLMKSAARNDVAFQRIAKTFKIQNKFNWTMLLGYTLLALGYLDVLHDLSKMQSRIHDLESTD